MTVMNNLNLLLVGVGGQGTILASNILAEVALKSGRDVKMSEILGMAQRGGSVVTQVKMGEKVFSPLIDKGEADIVLAFEQLEALRWLEYVKPQGEVIINTQVIEPLPVILGKAQYPQGIIAAIRSRVKQVTTVNALEIAASCGDARAVNIVMMGVLAQKLDFPKAVWVEALKNTVKSASFAINLKAFEKGFNI